MCVFFGEHVHIFGVSGSQICRADSKGRFRLEGCCDMPFQGLRWSKVDSFQMGLLLEDTRFGSSRRGDTAPKIRLKGCINQYRILGLDATDPSWAPVVSSFLRWSAVRLRPTHAVNTITRKTVTRHTALQRCCLTRGLIQQKGRLAWSSRIQFDQSMHTIPRTRVEIENAGVSTRNMYSNCI